MTIKVLEKTQGCFPQEFEIGDWFDLCTAEEVTLKAPQAHKMHIKNKGKEGATEIRTRDVDFNFKIIPLGIAIALPEGMEAYILPRSSTFKKYGLIQTNSKAVVDYAYRGENDEWRFPVIATKDITIPKGTRIAQFRVQLSQKATVWQKIKWLFSNGTKLKKVSSLNNPNRGGIGDGTGI